MIKIYGKSLADYRRYDPQGAFGWLLDGSLILAVILVIFGAIVMTTTVYTGINEQKIEAMR